MPNLGVGLPMDEMDPLCVDPPVAITYCFDEWIEQKEQPDPDLLEPFSIDLAPDDLHKANISGGGPYAVLVPFLGADPIFTNERHDLPFLDYLRLAFRWAGFPNLEGYAERADVRRFVSEFGRGLMPFWNFLAALTKGLTARSCCVEPATPYAERRTSARWLGLSGRLALQTGWKGLLDWGTAQ
jgi:hypothetical protein